MSTDRLNLRHYEFRDFDPFAEYFASERSRYADGPVPRDRAWDLFASGAGRWSLLGYGAWAIERRSDGVMAGLVSLNPPFAIGEPELGWTTLVSGIHEANTKSIRLAGRLGAYLDPSVFYPREPETRFYRFRAAGQPDCP